MWTRGVSEREGGARGSAAQARERGRPRRLDCRDGPAQEHDGGKRVAAAAAWAREKKKGEREGSGPSGQK